MRVLVLGAGVVGMATAWYLWRDGHEVTVVDRRSGPAEETSRGNAGGLCPSFAGPWAAPGMVGRVLRQSMQRDAPIRWHPRLDPRQWEWIARWVANCNAEAFARNKRRMQRVAHYSLACLKQLRVDAGLNEDDFDFRSAGVLQLFRTPQQLEVGRLAAQSLQAAGVPWRLLDADDVDALEPALAHRTVSVAGALHLPADARGDSHKFSRALAQRLAAQGVRFLFDTPIHALLPEGRTIGSVQAGGQRLRADAYVVALGSQAPRLLRPLGIGLPVYPLKGYSITVPLGDGGPDFQGALMDEHNKVMITRLGDRVRAAGMAELSGDDLRLDPAQRDKLVSVVREWFPLGLDFDRTEFWAGLRPMTPDGPPVLGATPWPNLFLNSGHGSNGWTQSCGTARIVADIVGGRTPAIDLEGLTGERYGIRPAAPAPVGGRSASATG